MIRRPPRSTLSSSSAASDVYKRQILCHGSSHDSWQAGEAVREVAVQSFKSVKDPDWLCCMWELARQLQLADPLSQEVPRHRLIGIKMICRLLGSQRQAGCLGKAVTVWQMNSKFGQADQPLGERGEFFLDGLVKSFRLSHPWRSLLKLGSDRTSFLAAIHHCRVRQLSSSLRRWLEWWAKAQRRGASAAKKWEARWLVASQTCAQIEKQNLKVELHAHQLSTALGEAAHGQRVSILRLLMLQWRLDMLGLGMAIWAASASVSKSGALLLQLQQTRVAMEELLLKGLGDGSVRNFKEWKLVADVENENLTNSKLRAGQPDTVLLVLKTRWTRYRDQICMIWPGPSLGPKLKARLPQPV
eukprot:TRINITY_DN24863_c0_g1_i2.p1 TRINITY_DN24863_c0_g1~~TRINITY_DN24863_c0_g1_i2.p1  ORF type:complete len:358 (+),score=54.76 TRINITY_DN24863_c0_g1_i2:107-1180(+)